MGYHYLLDLALILLSTKVLGLFSQRLRMPQVVGALVAGLLLGPAALGIIEETDFLRATASLGVIVLMFTSGMETDLNELKRCGKSAFLIALAGVLLPLLGGFAVGHYFNDPTLLVNNTPGPQGSLLLQNVFLGIILTATSVSITVETLRELGKLRGTAGSVILAAAIIDDVLGIVALTIVTSFSDDSVHVGLVLLKILLFFVFAVVAGVGFARSYRWWTGKTEENRTQHAIVAFVFCLLMSYLAEEVFGVADITGAFVAGLVLANATTGLLPLPLPGVLRQHRPAGGPFGHEPAHPSLCRGPDHRGHPDQDPGLRPGGQAVPVLPQGVLADRRRHDFPRRGGADRRHQGSLSGADQPRAFRPRHRGGGGHHHHHPHPVETGFPGPPGIAPPGSHFINFSRHDLLGAPAPADLPPGPRA